VKKIFLFLIFFFAFSFSYLFLTQNSAYADVTLCEVSDTNCIPSWNNEVRLPKGHILTQEDVNEIIPIVERQGLFEPEVNDIGDLLCGLTPIVGCLSRTLAKEAIKDAFTKSLNYHIGQEWSVQLLSSILVKFQLYLQYVGCMAVNIGNLDGKCVNPLGSGTGGAICDSGDQCLSGTCTSGRCVPGTAEIVCKKSGTGSDPKFICRTAIGPINTDVAGFSKSILQLLLGLSGGILLVMIVINGYKIMTSQGDPEKIKDAREGVIAAIAGILLIIFSVSILQLITVDILGIPGFTK